MYQQYFSWVSCLFKKRTLLFAYLLFLSTLITYSQAHADALKDEPAKHTDQTSQKKEETAEADPACIPSWQNNLPSSEDWVYGTGLANFGNAALSKKASGSKAKDEVVQKIQIKIQTMIKNFIQQIGIEELLSLPYGLSPSISHITY